MKASLEARGPLDAQAAADAADPARAAAGRDFLLCRLDASGCFTFASPELLRLFACEDIVGQPFTHFVYPADLASLTARFEQALASRDLGGDVYRFCSAEGQIHHLRLLTRTCGGHEGVVGLSVAMAQVSEQPSRDQLSAAERYRLLVEKSLDILCTLDLELNFTYVSPSVTALLGFSESEMLSLNLQSLLSAPDGAQVQGDLAEAFRLNAEVTKAQLRRGNLQLNLITASGATVWVEIKRQFIRDEAGRPIGIVAIGRDITEHMAEEAERRSLEQQLIQFQKLESLGTLAGGIVHDFNNLLMGIQGNVSLMLLEVESDSPACARLKNIEAYVESGAKLTRQLLGFARGGKYEPRPQDINALVNESLQMFGRTRKEIEIVADFAAQVHAVEIDKTQIEQVLLNIFVNAWQAMPQGGQLRVATDNIALNGRQARSLQLTPGRYVRIEITDTGCGMDEATRLRVFEPFFSTKGMGHGTGLGLASAYGIVLNHGGSITVKSRPMRGSSFAIYLPASDRPAEREIKRTAGIILKDATVLIVDDEAMILEVGAEMLEQLGCQAVTASGGREALEIYAAHEGAFDLVILDMIMPGMGGGETYDRLKQLNPEVRVILSTGYSCTGQAAEIMRRGCNGFIQKPFNLEALSQKIHEVLARECRPADPA